MEIVPVIRDDATAVFFDGTRAGELLLRRRRSTGTYADLRAVPALSGDTDIEYVPAGGGGRVVSWATVHRGHRSPNGPNRTVVGIVELDEGPWWWCRLTEVDPDENLADLRVQVAFVPSGPDPEHEVIPVFRPAGPEDQR